MLDVEKFMSRVKKDSNGCWVWTGQLQKSGYGICGRMKNRTRAHRLSYQLFIGDIPAGLNVLHHCDNPPCVNPSHLYAGTNWENSQDRVRRDRGIRGVRHPSAKITEDDARAIFVDRRTQKEIAAAYGICKAAVYYVKIGHSWRLATEELRRSSVPTKSG